MGSYIFWNCSLFSRLFGRILASCLGEKKNQMLSVSWKTEIKNSAVYSFLMLINCYKHKESLRLSALEDENIFLATKQMLTNRNRSGILWPLNFPSATSRSLFRNLFFALQHLRFTNYIQRCIQFPIALPTEAFWETALTILRCWHKKIVYIIQTVIIVDVIFWKIKNEICCNEKITL
jgi:hypothetical protein